MRIVGKNNKGSNERSILYSKIIIVVFGILLLLVDLRGPWVIRYLLELSPANYFGNVAHTLMLVYLYLCNIPAYIVLAQLFLLLKRITKGEIFTVINIKCFRVVSWCCLIVGVITLPFILIWPLLSVVALAAGLVGLILRIVKNVFEQAVSMKDELDFTV